MHGVWVCVRVRERGEKKKKERRKITERKTEKENERGRGREKYHTYGTRTEEWREKLVISCACEKSNHIYIFNPVIVTFHANIDSFLVSSLLSIST